jgi:hypothetical protein
MGKVFGRRLICLAFLVFILSARALWAGDITVAVTVEKLTLGQGFIVGPTIVTAPEGSTAEDVIKSLFDGKGLEYDAWPGDFYLAGLEDPTSNLPLNVPGYIKEAAGEIGGRAAPGYLRAFDYTDYSGWMFSVNDESSSIGASGITLRDGDVMRWQFSLYGYGADIFDAGSLDEGYDFAPLKDDLGDKGELIWLVAEMAADGDTLGAAYVAAMNVLEAPDSTQSQVDAALSALTSAEEPDAPGVPETPPAQNDGDDNGGGGGGCDAGAGTAGLLALAAFFSKFAKFTKFAGAGQAKKTMEK